LDANKEYAKKLGLQRVEFLGATPSASIFAQSKIVAVTSTHEGFGMTLVEGMSVGAVPIAYDSYTALSDIVEDRVNGYKVTAFEEDEFVKKLSSLMSDDELREQMSMNALKTPQKFAAPVIADRWIKLFESLMK
jgi:glycosyltransferase involved in cell wall biosynthesis